MSYRILFISHEDSRTGAPLVLYYLMKYIKSNTNISFDLIIKNKIKHMASILPLFEEVCTPVFLNWPDSKDILIKYADYDLIYCNTCTVGDVRKLLPKNIKTITHVHEMRSSITSYPCMCDFLTLTDLFIPVSRQVKNSLLELGVNCDKIVDPTGEPFYLRENIQMEQDPNVFTVGFSGTACSRKGIDFLAPLAKRVSELIPKNKFKFIWVGNLWDKDAVTKSNKFLHANSLSNNVIFSGEYEDPFDVYKTFDIFVLLSKEDPFPLVGLECASLGCPILCFSEVCGLDNFIEQDAGFCIPPFNLSHMAEKINKLYTDSVLRKTLGDRAKIKVQKYTTENVCKKLTDTVIKSLIGNIRIQQIYFKDEQLDQIEDKTTAYNNKDTSYMCEFGVLRKEYPNLFKHNEEYEGFLSWRFTQKTSKTSKDFYDLINKNPGYDAYSIQPARVYRWIDQNINFWEQGELHHRGTLAFIKNLLDSIGYDSSVIRQRLDISRTITCNYWVANKKFWEKYMGYVLPICDALLKYSKESPEKYDFLFKQQTDAEVKPDFYTLSCGRFPFIMERVIVDFLHLNKDIKVYTLHTNTQG